MGQRGILRTMGDLLGFWCPGCLQMHVVNVVPDAHPCWGFNGDYEKPTFSPSILTWRDAVPDAAEGFEEYRKPYRCHSFVTGGQIQFLDDCTHALAGQTVPLTAPPFAHKTE